MLDAEWKAVRTVIGAARRGARCAALEVEQTDADLSSTLGGVDDERTRVVVVRAVKVVTGQQTAARCRLERHALTSRTAVGTHTRQHCQPSQIDAIML